MSSITLTSIVNASPPKVAAFLASLEEAGRAAGGELAFLLIDATGSEPASQALRRFAQEQERCVVLAPQSEEMAEQKDELLHRAVAEGASHVLLSDSNLVLPPPLPGHLAALEHDIVAEVYWTEWELGAQSLPGVWQCDQYGLWPREFAQASVEQRNAAGGAFVAQLRQQGTYPVGGLGGCVMVSAAAVSAGCSFKPVPNLGFWGEDRHFCVRAAVLGFGLWADTQMPPLHLYRDSDLGLVPAFWAQWQQVGVGA